jgi:hypothetical protein
VLDPEGVDGDPEIVKLTAHTGAADNGTIERGLQSTTNRAHNSGTVWSTAVTKADADKWPVRLLTTTGDIMYASAANTPARLGVGAAGVPLIGGASVPSYGQVVTAGITDLAVTTAKIADSNVTLGKMADNSVGTVEIVDDAVTIAKIGGAAAKGDLLTNTAANAAAWLTVGDDGQVLVAASGESTGLEYAYYTKPTCQVADAAQTINDSTNTTISFDAADEIDTHGWHDPGSNPSRVLPTIAGWYRVTISATAAVAVNTCARFIGLVLKDGSLVPGSGWDFQPFNGAGATAFPSMTATGPLIQMNGTTNYFEMRLYQDDTGGANRNYASWMTVTLEVPT